MRSPDEINTFPHWITCNKGMSYALSLKEKVTPKGNLKVTKKINEIEMTYQPCLLAAKAKVKIELYILLTFHWNLNI